MVSVRVNELHRITVDEYHRIADAGAFDDGERVELLDGLLVSMAPQKSPHAYAITVLNRLLCRVLADNFAVRPQLPLTLGKYNEPEPDLAVVTTKSVAAAAPLHPSTALLVVEVADATLRKDRSKAALYAAAGVKEFWIVNVKDRSVEVMRSPADNAYEEHVVVSGNTTLRSTALRGVELKVAALFMR